VNTTLTIRNLDETVKQKLRLRAARHQTSMEAEARHLDPRWKPWSTDRLVEYFGRLLINPMVYAKLGCRVSGIEELEPTLAPFELEY
jgi:predicted nucleic acid-binding protein